jgi:hypothetical protein
MPEIIDLTPDIDANCYRIEITRPNGSAYVANLPRDYADGRTRLQKYGKGIVVVHPLLPKVYINGTTGQMGPNPEICRSSLIIDPAGPALGQEMKDVTHEFRRKGR